MKPELLERLNKAFGVNLTEEKLESALKDLSPREEKVLRFRFGMDDGITRTLEECGRFMGVTRERIRQIEAKAFARIRSNDMIN